MNEKINNAPTSPGVYLMKDWKDAIIYVGKARHLRNRIRNYFSGTDSRPMVPFLVSRVHDVDFIITKTEKEALLLENSLIKEHHPRYNVNLRDDKTYLNIRIAPTETFPRFQLVRRPKQDGALYFGPYPASAAAKETLRFLQWVFPLRTCSDQELNTRKRPCLEYEIKRCLAPCVGLIDASSYGQLVMDAVAFLEGREKKLTSDLRKRMKAASVQSNFEEAATLRDRIAAIEETLEKQRVVSVATSSDQDVFGLYCEGALSQVCIVFIRQGRILGIHEFPLLKVSGESPEVLSSLVKQYYDSGGYIPEKIMLPCALDDQKVIADWLSEKKSQKVSLLVPRKGNALEILQIAMSNAQSVFNAQKQSSDYYMESVALLASTLGLKNQPIRMECFDISNIGGQYAVGSMVTFVDGKPWKPGYKRFKIKTVEGADDYAMMHEVLNRRYFREANLPDLIVVDGGKGQLGVAVAVLKDLGIEGVDIIGLAKAKTLKNGLLMEDHVFLPGRKNAIFLTRSPSALFLLQKIRDEAHRFAVSYYSKLKRKRDFQSVLDDIPGIGQIKKRALLSHFGGIRNMAEASVETLQNVKGIGKKQAGEIRAFLMGKEKN